MFSCNVYFWRFHYFLWNFIRWWWSKESSHGRENLSQQLFDRCWRQIETLITPHFTLWQITLIQSKLGWHSIVLARENETSVVFKLCISIFQQFVLQSKSTSLYLVICKERISINNFKSLDWGNSLSKDIIDCSISGSKWLFKALY